MRKPILTAAICAVSACATTGEGVRSASDGRAAFPSKPMFRLADISGKEAADIDGLLGAPELTRSEGKGEFRRYRLDGCSLLVILYPDDKGDSRATKIDAAALKSGEEKPDLDLCLARGRQQ
jgi:hypothetical protein